MLPSTPHEIDAGWINGHVPSQVLDGRTATAVVAGRSRRGLTVRQLQESPVQDFVSQAWKRAVMSSLLSAHHS